MMKGSMFKGCLTYWKGRAHKVAFLIERGMRTKLSSWLKGACAQSCLLDWKVRVQDLWWTCLWHTSPSVSESRARHARNKGHWSVCVHIQFLSSGKGSALWTCCWRRRWAPRTCTCDDLSTTTHPLQHRSFELDRQETSATEVCESSFSSYKLIPVCLFLHPF